MNGTASKFGLSEDPRLETARKRLHESMDQADTLEAIREIVTGLLGCEEIGVFSVDQGKSELFWSFGIDPERHRTLDRFEPEAVRRALNGECHVLTGDREKIAGQGTSALQVFVPIFRGGQTGAVLVMVQLLPQKVEFDGSDLRLANLLSYEAGRGLFEANPKARAARRSE